MTPTTLAETILRDVPRYPHNDDADNGFCLRETEVIAALTTALDPAIAERAGKVVERMKNLHGAFEWEVDTITAVLAQNAALRVERDALAGQLEDALFDSGLRLGRAEAAEAQIAALRAEVRKSAMDAVSADCQAQEAYEAQKAAEAERDALRAKVDTMIDAATVQKMLDDAQPIMAEACRGYEEANADLQARLTAAEAERAALRAERDEHRRNWERAFNANTALEAQIATLTARVEELTGALRPFAEALQGNYAQQSDDMQITAGHGQWDMRFSFRLGDFRRARVALTTEADNDRA